MYWSQVRVLVGPPKIIFIDNYLINSFKLEGSENIGSVYKISKNINDFEIDFRLNNQDALKPNIIDEATINLKKIF